MHDLGVWPNGDKPIGRELEVLCGVEALSAQRWVVGAISFCVDGFRKAAKRDG